MAYKTIWEIEVRHTGLGKYRHIRGSDKYVVEQKALHQQLQWDEQWQRKIEADQRVQERTRAAEQRVADHARSIREKERLREQTAAEKERQRAEAQRYKDERNQEALDRDAQAKAAVETLRDVLKQTLQVDDAIDWEELKDTTTFKEPLPELKLPPRPGNQPYPSAPTPDAIPKEPSPSVKPNAPDRTDSKYQVVFSLLDRLSSSRKTRKLADAEALFQRDHNSWIEGCKTIDAQDASELQKWGQKKTLVEIRNASLVSEWERSIEIMKKEDVDRRSFWDKECERVRAKHDEAVRDWKQREEVFCSNQKKTNAAIEKNRENYMAKEQGAVADYCDLVLSNSSYPDYFPKEWDLDYNSDTRTLVVEYALPAPTSLPTLKEVQYVQSKDTFKETQLSEKERDGLYDSLLYQIALRTIHELFEADTANALDAVVFSGIVTALDKSTGHDVSACVLSVLARKEPFLQVNLDSIDPKACFKSLKGVAASKLSGLSAIPPVMTIDKNDRRFVAARGIVDAINAGTNLATMDWEDFEHLIREVFEQEFVAGGGEVKVTQASRDGGVDAIAFDPDPIRGGKIVIQAKRYANTVGVSAVRDLYGTVMNEGATKGILVTTADYGPDAYEFATGKPLTLLNGSNLLHLLEKHGHQARIDLREAKQEAR